MAEKILIPLDGSSFGERALKYIEGTLRNLEPEKLPEVTLLHVVQIRPRPAPVEGGVFNMPTDFQDLAAEKEQALAYLEAAAEPLRRTGAKVTCLVMDGEPGVSSAAAIIAAEQETGADLVAMSTHGRRGLTRWAFGSVTEKVLRSGSVPVLMVRLNK